MGGQQLYYRDGIPWRGFVGLPGIYHIIGLFGAWL